MNISVRTASRSWRLPLIALGATLGVFASSAGWAQGMGSGPLGTSSRAVRQGAGAPEKPEVPAPNAIPGASARVPAAPATRPAGDMQPTDALFDAINRGDIASARDALNRGADLNGVNILGMTPMELSVDLGRNDISFLLLSMRGEDGDRAAPAHRHGTPIPANQTARAGRQTGPGKAVPGKVAKAVDRPSPTRPVATPKLFANDGGTPLPSAGFLGFDSRSASN